MSSDLILNNPNAPNHKTKVECWHIIYFFLFFPGSEEWICTGEAMDGIML